MLPENELIECKGVTPGVFYFRLCIRISVCSDFINAIILERGWLLEYVLLEYLSSLLNMKIFVAYNCFQFSLITKASPFT